MMENDSDHLVIALESLNNTSFSSHAERVKIKSALEAALYKIESPWETALRLSFVEPALYAALKICWDVGLFRKWVDLGERSYQTATQLANMAGVEKVLMERILRHLRASHILEQRELDTYALVPFSTALGASDLNSIVPFIFNTTLPAFANLPGYLEDEGYRNPDAFERTNWHHFRGKSRFEDLAGRPEEMLHFQRVMAARAASHSLWTDLYPVSLITESARPGVPLVVDVGGAHGFDLARFHSLAGSAACEAGALVLQDQPSAVQNAIKLKGMTVMAHDFFEEQPVRGAKVYYLHKVLHDWPDGKATLILKRLAEAMEPNYSRILLHEIVITRNDVSAYNTASDMTMMAVVSGCERTEAVWDKVITAAQLKVEKVWSSTESLESIIEIVRCD